VQYTAKAEFHGNPPPFKARELSQGELHDAQQDVGESAYKRRGETGQADRQKYPLVISESQ